VLQLVRLSSGGHQGGKRVVVFVSHVAGCGGRPVASTSEPEETKTFEGYLLHCENLSQMPLPWIDGTMGMERCTLDVWMTDAVPAEPDVCAASPRESTECSGGLLRR
jgi:hypothetical protein